MLFAWRAAPFVGAVKGKNCPTRNEPEGAG
jgi:hypothetical protein